jgi:hypothetical protein
MNRLIFIVACLLIVPTSQTQAITLKSTQALQKRNPLICRVVFTQGAGWCNGNPTGRTDLVAGGPCNCGSFKLGYPFNETIVAPAGHLERGVAPAGVSGRYELFARFRCEDPGRSKRGQC